MRKAKIILGAALFALAWCAPCYADAVTGKTKVATQEWVRRTLAQSGIRVSAGNVTTNITTEGGTAVTNITTEGGVTVTNITVVGGTTVTNLVFTSPFSDTNFPGIVSISLTFSQPVLNSGAAQTPARGARLLRAASGGPSITVQLKKGMLLDGSGGGFLFADMWEMTWTDFPEAPPDTHVCQLDSGCNCVEKDNTEAALKEAMPDEYKTLTDKEALAKWPDPSVFYPDWGTESWQITRTFGQGASQRVVYYVNAYDPDGVREQPIRVSDIGNTDAWMDAVVMLIEEWNAQMQLWQRQYIEAHLCPNENPQHNKVTTTCGTHSWTVCANGCGYKEGTEQHDYPGTVWNQSWHSCKCGHGPTEAHGTLIPDGEKTPTYNGDGTETGWTQTYVCPKGCGHYIVKTHVHHFTNCGTCDAGDDCETVCTGCGGNHVFGEPANGKCAKCECTMCNDCNAHPPYDDETKHAGWHPCGEADEEDNDNADGSANGAHCACQCLAWGHNAALSGVHESKHDYQFPTGFSRYEQISDASATDYAKTHHYELIGKCSREGCGRWKKVRESHTWPENPTRYAKISESTCRSYYACTADGCGYEKHEDGNHAPTGGTVYEAITVNGSPKCRQKRLCANCEAYVSDDTNDHVRGDKCKCANGCGYQFEHAWAAQDACGNVKCSHCGTYKYSQESHAGYKSGGTYSAAGHQCACGVKPDIPHVFGSWTETGVDVGVIHYSRTCTACPYEETKDEPCPHTTYGTPVEVSRSGWLVVYRKTCTKCGYSITEEANTNPCRNGHVALQSECGCACGYYSPSNNVSTSTEFHKWDSSDTDSDGVENCMCKCNTLHTFRSSTYLNNSGTRCPNVCAYCRLRKRDGTYADEDDHEPKASRFERCGCACGRLDSSAKASKFHIPKPGTCTCYGGDGNGGTRHFKHPKTGCTRICAYLKDGEEHLTAARDGEEGTTAAYPKDHTKTDSIGLCGCKCREFDGDEPNCPSAFHNQNPSGCGCYCTHSSKSGHHRWPSNSCWCYCLEQPDHKWSEGECYCLCGRNHRIIQRQDGKCPRVCHGPCNEYLYARDKHSPKEDSCGCECGQFAGADYTSTTFHHGHGSPSCMCACGLHHINLYRRADCTAICSQCGDHKTNYALVDPLQAAPSSAHSWTADSCYCKCGKFVDHKFASNSCTCYCEATQRAHLWRVQSDGVIGSHTCETCGKTISEHEVVYECSRCGELIEGYYETGHADSCGDAHDNDNNLDPCGCGCTDCSCSACSSGTGRCTTCGELCGDEEGNGGGGGGGNGGSTGGGGGYGDI